MTIQGNVTSAFFFPEIMMIGTMMKTLMDIANTPQLILVTLASRMTLNRSGEFASSTYQQTPSSPFRIQETKLSFSRNSAVASSNK